MLVQSVSGRVHGWRFFSLYTNIPLLIKTSASSFNLSLLLCSVPERLLSILTLSLLVPFLDFHSNLSATSFSGLLHVLSPFPTYSSPLAVWWELLRHIPLLDQLLHCVAMQEAAWRMMLKESRVLLFQSLLSPTGGVGKIENVRLEMLGYILSSPSQCLCG